MDKACNPHSFRHMHITYLQSEGMKVAIKEIMERVGHANYETTMLYILIVKEYLKIKQLKP